MNIVNFDYGELEVSVVEARKVNPGFWQRMFVEYWISVGVRAGMVSRRGSWFFNILKETYR
ncbi:MAG: hypothetical protein GY861_28580 [bacterium]|nr:hypothetical protein [bacterium]